MTDKLQSACDTIVETITRGDKDHIVRSKDSVLLIGDYIEPSQEYTRKLRISIENIIGASVEIMWLPKKRPMEKHMIPYLGMINKKVEKADCVIGTYGNQGTEMMEDEMPLINKAFLTTAEERMSEKTKNPIRLYVVASHPNINVLELCGKKGLVEKMGERNTAIKAFLDAREEKTVEIKYRRNVLSFEVPKKELIKIDGFSVSSNMMNFPPGEVFFEPVSESGKGELLMTDGSFYKLSEPVEGEILFEIKKGYFEKEFTVKGKPEKFILDTLKEHFKDKKNRYLAELGIGTFLEASDLSMEDKKNNKTILEKLAGYHIAYGESLHVGGSHDAEVHIDNLFKYGDVTVDGDYLYKDGNLVEEFAEP